MAMTASTFHAGVKMTASTLLTYAFLLAAVALIVLLFAATRRKRPAEFDGGFSVMNNCEPQDREKRS